LVPECPAWAASPGWVAGVAASRNAIIMAPWCHQDPLTS
jgi:hypothetical protein